MNTISILLVFVFISTIVGQQPYPYQPRVPPPANNQQLPQQQQQPFNNQQQQQPFNNQQQQQPFNNQQQNPNQQYFAQNQYQNNNGQYQRPPGFIMNQPRTANSLAVII